MTLSDISIKNTVFAWILMFGLIIFGAIGFSRMGISQLPDVDFPVVTITVTWVGASPETMESAVADVLEDAVMTIQGIKNVSSASQEGLTNITIEFELDRNIDTALQEVQTKIIQAQRNLPNDIDPPIVIKTNPEDMPIIWAALTGTADFREMVVFVRDHLKDAVATINGVGNIFLGGYIEPNMRIWLNLDQMTREEITVDDVINTVISQHTLTPSGYMENGPRESNVRILSEARTPEEFGNLIIAKRSGEPIWKPLKLSQVAKIEKGLADIRRISRSNGQSAVGLGIIKQRGSNAVSVGRLVKKKLEEFKRIGLIHKDMLIRISYDSTKYIEEATNDLLFTLILSVALTSLVCWLFLGSFSSAFNVILAIPTSLVGSFIVLYFLGFTINTFTLLALSLSIGIVVDDAIMVLENIVRYFEAGMSRVRAALVGAREITSAAVAASLAILAIFLPVVFMKGIIGKFFFQFGVAMSVAILLSLLEALTLTPMRCSQLLRTPKETRVGKVMDRFMDFLSRSYRTALVRCLDNRWKVIITAFAIFAGSLFLIGGARKEFVPPQDIGIFMMTLRTPLGSSLEFTDGVVRKAEAIFKSRPEIVTYYTAIGGFQGGLVNQDIFFITLKDYNKRPVVAPFKHRPTQQEFMNFARDQVKKIPGLETVSVLDPSLGGFSAARGYPIQFSVQGPDWEKLGEFSKKIMAEMNKTGLVTDVDTDLLVGMPELRISPNRNKAAERGVTITNIADTISASVGSLRVGKYTDESGHRDDIRIKLLDRYNRQPRDINNIMVRNIHGEVVRLANLVNVQEKPSLLTINRYNRERAVSIFANIAEGKSQTDILTSIENISKKILSTGYFIVFSGSSETFKESFQSLVFALVLGILVAYMILGTQYNSFIHPVTILMALPFSVTGAFIAIRLTGISLNIYSMIGILLLMGIVKKNSIMLVDFTNTRRIAGMGVHEALLEACPIRLRPILMTSTATIAAALPPAMAFGLGSETTRPMAIVVIGGVLMSTLLTLFVVPCAYSLFSRFESKRHQEELHEALVSLGEIETKKKKK